MSTVRFEDILQLSLAERLDLVEKIWDSIEADPELLPLTQAQREELDRRLEAHSKNPEELRVGTKLRPVWRNDEKLSYSPGMHLLP
jgi:putative addiction module component (TIGR02574 family)